MKKSHKCEIKKKQETNEKAPKVADKITGEYKVKSIYWSSRRKYYINSNGNKNYIRLIFINIILLKNRLNLKDIFLSF
jgi:colicin import membrane protein